MDREARMIVRLPRTLASSPDLIADRSLKRLDAYWNRLRGPALAPGADVLYLSNLAAEIPHVLLCFRDGEAYRIEFAGAEAQDLLGFDPTGEILKHDDPEQILAGLSRVADIVARSKSPDWPRGDGWAAIVLPFVEAGQEVTVLLAGLIPVPPSVPETTAEVLPFKPK